MMTDSDPNPAPFKSGYVTIAGAPNSGKSTLLNRILGEKISIISSKPQTTRTRILGVCHRPGAQIVFYDTPGVFVAKDTLNLRIVDTAIGAIGEADVLLAVVDAARPDPEAEDCLLQKIQDQKHPAVLALNKIDLVPDKQVLLETIGRWSGRHPFEAVVPVSALDGTQVEEVISAIVKALPAGPAYYPEDTLTDVTERFIASELIREKLFRLTGEEIPYASAVTVEAYKPSADGKRREHRGDDPPRARFPEGDRHRQGWRRAETDRYRGPAGHRADDRSEGLPEAVRAGAEKLAQGQQGHRALRLLIGVNRVLTRSRRERCAA